MVLQIWKEILIFSLCIFLHLLHLLRGSQGPVVAWLLGRLLLFLQLWMLHFVFAMVVYSVCSWVSLVSVAIGIGMSSKNLMPDFRLMVCYLTAFERFCQSMSSTLGTQLCFGAMVLVYFRALLLIIFLEQWGSPLRRKFCIISGFGAVGLLFSSQCWCLCSCHSGFHHCLQSVAPHWHLHVALDHGILELTLSLLLCYAGFHLLHLGSCVYTRS